MNYILVNVTMPFKHMEQKRCSEKIHATYITQKGKYVAIVCSPRLESSIDLLEKVQRKAAKVFPELKELNYRKKTKAMDVPTVEDRKIRKYVIPIFFFNEFDDIDVTFL